MKIIALSLMAISLNNFAAQTADKPLSTLSVGAVKPNVMFIIDDSGSMAWSHMPDEVKDWRNMVGYRNSLCNGVYYNPNTTYLAPKNANGKDMPNSSFNAAWSDGFSIGSTTTHNLSNAFFAYDNKTGAQGYKPTQTDRYTQANASPVKAFYWELKTGITFNSTMCSETVVDNSLPLNDPKANASTINWVKKYITSDKETNFANWFSYYRTRILMMKSSAGAAFNNIGDRYRVGFSSINNLKDGSYDDQSFLNINNYASTQKQSWYDMLYSVSPGGGTPLKTALNAIGQIYSGKLPSTEVIDPMEYSCQQNFTILTTDGYWNDTSNTGVGNTDNQSNIPDPMKDATSNVETLADVAMYYFKNDLRPQMLNNVPGVEAFAGGEKGRQIMRTYTLGLGMNGNLDKSKYPDPLSGPVLWPSVVPDTKTTIDDLWHAAVNGGGQYFSAKDPNAVAVGLSKALTDIEAKTASIGAADVSSSFMSQGDNYIYDSSFKNLEWTGEVVAKVLDLNTGKLQDENKWSAQTLLTKMGHTERKIYTCSNNACNSRLMFDPTNTALVSAMAAGVSTLGSTLSPTQAVNNTPTALINYLRGDISNEIKAGAATATSLYRARAGRLGAVIHGGVSYVKKPNKAYTDAGYADFMNKSRKGMVYAPANDGMLHAFNADTGAEEWAFVPPSLFPKLWQLADRAFSNDFKFFADGAPTIADIYTDGKWKTILVAGLREGGAEYYALDITNPLDPQPLWNFTHSKLGKTYGFPVVGKIAGKWKVLLSSGYDNSDGKGYVFVLNAGSGPNSKGEPEQLISTSCSARDGLCGLAKIGVLFENKNVDDTIVMAYAGDLAGNLWRFKIGDGSTAAINVAQTGISTARQAITTAPVIKKTPYQSSSKELMHYITFGTGRYLNQTDMGSSDTHTFYGLIVDPEAAAMDGSFANLRTSVALSQLILDKSCDKNIKANLGGSVTIVDSVDVGNLSDSCISASDFDTMTLKRAADPKTTDTPEALNTCISTLKGWRADMKIPKERLANDPQSLGENAQFFTSIPGADACIANGKGRQYTFPMIISKNWLCSDPTIDKEITVGSNSDGAMLEDPKKIPKIVTPTDDSLEVPPGGPLRKSSPLLQHFKGRRSGWTEIVK